MGSQKLIFTLIYVSKTNLIVFDTQRSDYIMKEREPIDYGYGRCSVVYYQDYMYEKNALLSYGIKEEHIYLEYGSGADKDRPELNKLLNILQPGDSIRVTDITRLSRSTQHFCSILDFIKEKHLCLYVGSLVVDCRNDNLDVMVEAMLKISAVFGEMERKMRIEQIKLGQENARQQGHKIGRPKLTKEDIPDNFYKNLDLYNKGSINKTEFARIMNWTRNKLNRIIELNDAE